MNDKVINYPIIEAICEFQFIPGPPWDMTVPGLIYDKIKNEFPIKKQQKGFAIGFHPKKGEIEHKFELAPKIQFWRPDDSAIVQVGPNLLIINQLKPYPKWHTFKPLILNILANYNQTTAPKRFKRILLRYINRFDFNQKTLELSEFFNYYPFIPPGLPQEHGAFNIKVNFVYKEGRDHLLLELTTIPAEQPTKLSIIFDIGYVLLQTELIQIEQAEAWLETAHFEISNAFNASITENCKRLFCSGESNAISFS